MTRRFKMLGMAFVIVLLHTARASAAPEPVLCDEPAAGSCPSPAVAVASAPLPPRPRWQPRLSLAAISGVGAHGFLFGSSSGPSPFLGGELRVMWQKRASVIGLGLRLGATSTLGSEGRWASYEDSGSSSSNAGAIRVLGFDAAFVFSASWFWLSSGIGVMHVQDLRPGRSSDTTMPDATLALGLDIPLGDHFALRLYGQAATILVSARLNAGGGLVVRF